MIRRPPRPPLFPSTPLSRSGFVELAELAKDTFHALVVVQVGRRLAERVEGVVLPLVPPLVLAAEPPLEGLLGGRLDPVAGLLSHATQAQRPARAPRRRRG